MCIFRLLGFGGRTTNLDLVVRAFELVSEAHVKSHAVFQRGDQFTSLRVKPEIVRFAVLVNQEALRLQAALNHVDDLIHDLWVLSRRRRKCDAEVTLQNWFAGQLRLASDAGQFEIVQDVNHSRDVVFVNFFRLFIEVAKCPIIS